MAVFIIQIIPILSLPPAATQAWLLQALLYLSAALLFITGINASRASLHIWMQLYLIIAAIWSGLGLIVWLGGTQGEAISIGAISLTSPQALKISGPFEQGNIFACLIGFAWLFSHSLWIRKKHNIYALSILFFTIILLDTLSRGAWIAYAITIAVLLYAHCTFSFWSKCILPLWMTGMLIASILFEISQASQMLAADMDMLIEQAAISLHERILIWIISWHEFLSAPWFGHGWGQFPHQFWLAAPSALADANDLLGNGLLSIDPSLHNTAFNAHNIFLHTLAENGIFAGLLLLLACIYMLRQTCRLTRQPDSIRLPYALTAVAFLLHSQVGIVYNAALALLLAALFAGIALAPFLHGHCHTIKADKVVKSLIITAVSIVFIWTSTLSLQWFKAQDIHQNLNISAPQTIKQLDSFAHMPRLAAIPITSLAYSIAIQEQHSELLPHMIPHMERSLPEIPSITAHQVLFYAHMYAGNHVRACQLGRKIIGLNFKGEINHQAYQRACTGQALRGYNFGL